MTYIRSGLRERASTSGVLVSVPLCRVVEREMVGRSEKKGFVGHRLPLHTEIPALVRRAMVPAYIVSREKEKARASLCVHQKFRGVLISRRRSSLLRDDSRNRGARGRYQTEFFPQCTFNLLSYTKVD